MHTQEALSTVSQVHKLVFAVSLSNGLAAAKTTRIYTGVTCGSFWWSSPSGAFAPASPPDPVTPYAWGLSHLLSLPLLMVCAGQVEGHRRLPGRLRSSSLPAPLPDPSPSGLIPAPQARLSSPSRLTPAPQANPSSLLSFKPFRGLRTPTVGTLATPP